jgi:hypothetical protein
MDGDGLMEDVRHKRFTYKDNPCSGEVQHEGSYLIHECDLPNDHRSRHMCGHCGHYFGPTG